MSIGFRIGLRKSDPSPIDIRPSTLSSAAKSDRSPTGIRPGPSKSTGCCVYRHSSGLDFGQRQDVTP